MNDMTAPTAGKVIERKLLAEGIIISIPRPTTSRRAKTPDGVEYEQIGQPVVGGFVNFHLYEGDKCQKRGKRIWVEVKVFEKTMDDGRKFIYFDFFPTDAVHLTHVRKVHAQRDTIPNDLPVEALRFDTFEPIRGTVMFIPAEFFRE
jgi:hypothetical protein